jgi:hypothetical protein
MNNTNGEVRCINLCEKKTKDFMNGIMDGFRQVYVFLPRYI